MGQNCGKNAEVKKPQVKYKCCEFACGKIIHAINDTTIVRMNMVLNCFAV